MWERIGLSRKISSRHPGVNDLREVKESDELASHGVHYGLETIVSPQLLVDAVKMIA